MRRHAGIVVAVLGGGVGVAEPGHVRLGVQVHGSKHNRCHQEGRQGDVPAHGVLRYRVMSNCHIQERLWFARQKIGDQQGDRCLAKRSSDYKGRCHPACTRGRVAISTEGVTHRPVTSM